MRTHTLILFSLAAWPFQVPARAQEAASWLRTRTAANALNPNVSVSADMLGRADTVAQESGFALREAELTLQAPVDPYARADFFIAFPHGEPPELEEGYATLLALPWSLQVRAGKFLAGFGKLNLIHDHELPQADRPLVLSRFLGEEGLNDRGFEVSRIFGPFDVFTEFSFAFLTGLGEAEEDDPATTTITDDAGNPVTVYVATDEREVPLNKLRNYAQVARLRVYQDLSEAANLELGFSGALHEPDGFEQRRLGGMDMTIRWKPLQSGLSRSFIWRTEGVYSQRKLRDEFDPVTGALTASAATVDRRGAYSYVEWQFSRRWRAGLRGDYAEDPAGRAATAPVRALAPYLTFNASEFNRLRLQVQTRRAGGETEHAGFLQWTVVLGPHGAHAF